MTKLLLITALLLSPLPAPSQTKRPARKPAPVQAQAPISIQTATTKDGRTVLLKSDGTWEYTNDPPVVLTPQPAQPDIAPAIVSGSIALEAALVFRSGDVKPMARTTFHLLDENCAKILRAAGLKVPKESREGDTDSNLMYAFGLAWNFPTLRDHASFNAAANEALRGHTKQTVTTDFSGKAVFQDVPPGEYYVMGIGKTPRGFAVWNRPVTVKAGIISPITLDQNNADYAG